MHFINVGVAVYCTNMFHKQRIEKWNNWSKVQLKFMTRKLIKQGDKNIYFSDNMAFNYQ